MGVFDRISGLTGDDSEAEPSDEVEEEPSSRSAGPASMEPADFRDRAEDLAGRSNVPTLDFTAESLEKLDGLVAGTSRPVDDPVLFGSYLGEVLVRVFGGSWVRDEGWAVEVDQGDDETTVAVFDAARMALERGPVFQDVVAKLESEGATRAGGQPSVHREIDASATTATPSADDPVETATEDADDGTDSAGDDAGADADTKAEPAGVDAPGEVDGPDADVAEDATDDADAHATEDDDDADDAETSDEAEPIDDVDAVDATEAEAVEADTTEQDAAEGAASDPDADADGAEDEGIASDAADDEGTDFAAEKPELNVTIDEIEDDGEAPEEPADDPTHSESDLATADATEAVDADEREEERTAESEAEDGSPEPIAEAPSDADETEATDDGQGARAVETDPSADEASDYASTTEAAAESNTAETADEEQTTESVEAAGDSTDEGDERDDENEDFGVVSRIADLAASGGDPAATSGSDEAAADEARAAADADELAGEPAADEASGADDADEDAGPAVDDEGVAQDADDGDSLPVETAAPSIEESDATDAPLSADDAESAEEPETTDEPEPADAGPAGDEALEDLATEVSGPDLPPRPELKRAARDFSERWSDRGCDFTPESLVHLDEFVDGQWEGRFRPGSLEDASPHPREGLTPFARVGAYFGQMLVEHLDGEWIPTENGEGAVEVGDRRRSEEVHVFDVARTCLTRKSAFSYRFDALANQFDADATARAVEDVFDVGGERADSTDVIPAILDRAEAFTEDWPSAELDYSPASLARLDDLVEAEFAATDLSNARLGETTDADSLWFTERVTAAAAYYAAVLVSRLDANWRLEGDVRLVVEGPEGSHTVAPVTVAVGAIRGEDTFRHHLDRLAERVGRQVTTAE